MTVIFHSELLLYNSTPTCLCFCCISGRRSRWPPAAAVFTLVSGGRSSSCRGEPPCSRLICVVPSWAVAPHLPPIRTRMLALLYAPPVVDVSERSSPTFPTLLYGDCESDYCRGRALSTSLSRSPPAIVFSASARTCHTVIPRQAAGISQVVSSAQVKLSVLAQSCLCPGWSAVVANLLESRAALPPQVRRCLCCVMNAL